MLERRVKSFAKLISDATCNEDLHLYLSDTSPADKVNELARKQWEYERAHPLNLKRRYIG